MSEEDVTPEADITTPDDVKTEPPGNQDVDQDALDKGEDTLERVKPY